MRASNLVRVPCTVVVFFCRGAGWLMMALLRSVMLFAGQFWYDFTTHQQLALKSLRSFSATSYGDIAVVMGEPIDPAHNDERQRRYEARRLIRACRSYGIPHWMQWLANRHALTLAK